MDAILTFLQTPAAIIGLLCLTLLVILLLFGRQGKRFTQMDSTMERQLNSLQEMTQKERVSDRDEMGRSLRGMNETIVSVMGEISRTQQGQLDSFATQLAASHQHDEARMERMRQNIEVKLSQYDTQMTTMRQTLSDSLTRLSGDNERRLEAIRVTVDEKLHKTLDQRLGESFKSVSDRLEQVYKGLGEMQNLAAGVGDLKKVLTNVSTRGAWGEMQLGNILEQMLSPNQYDKNVSIKPNTTERVEFAIRMPGKDEGDHPVYLPIDSKFPMENYRRLMDAVDQGDRVAMDAERKSLSDKIAMEAAKIHEKYIAPPHTTDFAVMFLPMEGLYAEVLRTPGIMEDLQNKYRVTVTGPTTLAALLNSLQMGFRSLAVEKRSSEVWQVLGAVKSEFVKFAEILDRTQKQLNTASNTLGTATGKSNTIKRKLRAVQELPEVHAQQLLELTPDPVDMEDE